MITRDLGGMERIGNHTASGAAAFSDVGGATADPTNVTILIQKPDGTRLTYGWPVAGADGSVTREGLGRFYVDVALDQCGRWLYRIAGTGDVTAAAESYLSVEQSWTD